MAGQVKDLQKLCFFNLIESENLDKLRLLCEQFGRVVHMNQPASNKRMAFTLFSNESDAQRAKEGLTDKGYRVDYANARANKGENGSEDGARPKVDNDFRQKRKSSQRGSSLQGSDRSLDGSVGTENGSVEAGSVNKTNQPYGKCLRCTDKAYHNCGRCGDFYCSVECQASDWLKHKRECFPMPKLVPAKSTYSLHAGNSDSVETVKSPQTKKLDAANGEQKMLQGSPPLPKSDCVVATKSSHTSDITSSEKRPLIDESVAADKKAAPSPRARLLSQASNGPTSQPAAPMTPPAASVTSSAASGMEIDLIEDGSEVFINYVKSHQMVYVRSVAKDTEFSKMITEVGEASKNAPKLATYPVRNDIVMAPYDGLYYRAIVIKINKETASVHVGFIDFGNSVEVLFNQLKELPNELQQHRRMTTAVVLKDIQNEFEPEEIDEMKLYLEGLCANETKLKIKGDNSFVHTKDLVELFDIITNQSINDEIKKKGKRSKRYRLDDLECLVVNTKEESTLVNIGPERIHENLLTCIFKANIQEFMDEDSRIQEYGMTVKNAPAYVPKVKELCLVLTKDDGTDVWYRAQFQQELIDDKAQLYCIDYGRVLKTRINNIRAFPEILAHPVTSFIGRLKSGDTLSPEELKKYMEDPFVAKSVEYDGDMHIITV
ncbi:uncharacterized protein LOC116349100 [Contarinia nasturtii]|uniref:uncharacterized protein LOC116349100 n=1 Tax=Contarinia nasturtii TaxID=265458 RepID=UPI0012D3CD6D|nr:uncharacterized protein LOC116349100 [Contarinia nasturtii]